MTTSAIIMMVIVQVTVALVTGYFFFKVLRIPKRKEPDSFTENKKD
ncbi:MAG: hypothetical protein M3421_01275 [Bacteroidota bacterium]|jgi:heme/copper-type cytochrome/quinol oxidase subunit 2|nr:hypothetical protein [Bacteroidota bacterium]